MLKSFKGIARRQFFTWFGASALLGIAAQKISISAASARPIEEELTQTNSDYNKWLDLEIAQANPSGGDAIDILLDDHRKIAALMDRISQTPASNPTLRGQLLQQLANLLTVHNASEENYIYPAIREIAKRPNDATTLYMQQDQAKVILFELDRLAKDNTNWDKRFATLRSGILAHVQQEEKTDFPRLRQAAGSNMATLTAKVRQLRSAWNFT